MKRIFALAVLAPLAVTFAGASAMAEDTVIIKKRDGYGHDHHWRHREVEHTGSITKKVVIKKHGDGTTTKVIKQSED